MVDFFRLSVDRSNRTMPSGLKKICFFASICLIIPLGLAAVGKIFFPSRYFTILYPTIGYFECVFIALILLFRKKPWLWGLMAVILATWAGYAAAWYTVDFPCSCLGKLLDIPTIWVFCFDVLGSLCSFGIFFLLTRFLKIGKAYWILLACIIVSSAPLGFVFGKWLYADFAKKHLRQTIEVNSI